MQRDPDGDKLQEWQSAQEPGPAEPPRSQNPQQSPQSLPPRRSSMPPSLPSSIPARTFDSIRSFCLHVLESGDLESKLVPPRATGGESLPDTPGSAVFIDRPARLDHLRIGSGADRLPHLNELRDPRARSVCVERFANHELMAVELFAWALLAYPGMPSALRRGLLHVLEEEQGHVRLYLDRLRDLGSGLGQNALSDYFWQQVPAIHASSNGPASFLCVMGLTFEQANLDFSLLYRDAFRQQEDELSARALDQVHRDEIGHVRLAARWLRKIGGEPLGVAEDGPGNEIGMGDGSAGSPDDTDVALYERHIPFPLSAARAKGRRFDEAARRRAGLSQAFIEHVRAATPYSARSAVLYANFGAEERRDAKRAGPELLRLLSLWSGLFPEGTRVELPASTFPPGTVAPAAAFATDMIPNEAAGPTGTDVLREPGRLGQYLVRLDGLVAWYPDEAGTARAAALGVGLGTAPAEVVSRLHDKAFCAGVAAEFASSEFSEYVHVFDPEALVARDAEERIRGALATWPEPWRRRFVLKPRFGTSGRGRIAGSGAQLDEAGTRGLLRLAERGGALLEPWVERLDDLSAQFWVTSRGRVVFLGATRQVLGENGIYLGNRGVYEFTGDGALVVGSGHPMESRFLDDCRRLMNEVATAGFRGPCGIDGFTYLSPCGGEELRSLVEFNARFTVGTVALGWLERLLGREGSGEWWFSFNPHHARRMRGSEGAPRFEEGWTLVRLGADEHPAVLGLR